MADSPITFSKTKRNYQLFFSIFLITFLLQFTQAFAQEKDSLINSEVYYDKTDLPKLIAPHKKSNEAGLPVKGKMMAFIVPIIGSNPSLGAFFGFGGTGVIFFGNPETTSSSSLSSSFQFTSKNQFIASGKGTVMTNENLWEMLIDLRYSFFSEDTYGLGSDYNQPINESWNVGGVQTSGTEGAQPITFNYVRAHYTALKSVIDNFYLGIGYHIDYHYKIKDLRLDLAAAAPVLTSHYVYSSKAGIDPEKYTSSGTSLNILYDSRDHTVSPYKGSFLQASYRVNSKFLGSSSEYQQLYLETRAFLPLSKTIPRNVLGFWAIGQFITAGDAPYLDLPASGYDMRNRIGRGYVSGRFRGKSWVTAEAEYRVRLTRNGLIGAVLFSSITSTSRSGTSTSFATTENLKLFEAIRTAGGFGARISLKRAGRLNLGLDMAFGENGSKGFYFNVGETF